MRMLKTLLFVGLALTLSPTAEAKKIYLNGVDLDGVYLVNMTFKGCIVKLDAKGNVHITAPGYEIKPTNQAAPIKAQPKALGLAKDFYIVSFTNRKGATQYDVEVFLNGKFVRRIRHTEKQVVMNVTRYLKRGRNEVLFVARKNYGGKARASRSPLDYVRVVVGRGFLSKGRLVIKSVDAETKRTAAEDRPVIYDKKVIVVR